MVQNSENAVIIEQAEVITPLGNLAETCADLLEGESAIVPGPLFDIKVPFAPFTDTRYREISFCFKRLMKAMDLSVLDPQNTLVVYCAAKGNISMIENLIHHKNAPSACSPFLDIQASTVESILSITPSKTTVISNACASGAVGLEIAAEQLRLQRFAHAVVIGFDCLSHFTASGFFSLGALSPKGARPFDAGRDGLTMGEGAGIAVLSWRKPFDSDISIAGAATSNDANHRTGPSRTGDGLYNAARMALADAHMEPELIGAVKCHGTATPFNDAMEAKALYLLFQQNIPPCVSLKGALGHLSGAGSLIEVLISAECLKQKRLPPTIGYEIHGVDEPIPVSSKPQPIEKPSVLCLAAGFGGLNAAVVIREHVS